MLKTNKEFFLTTSQCERQGRELQFRCQDAVISGTTDSYGIIATEHWKLDHPPLWGVFGHHSLGRKEKKRKFSFSWRLQGFHNIASKCSKNLKKLELSQSEPKRQVTRKQVAIRNVLTTEITKLLHDTSWSQSRPALCLVWIFRGSCCLVTESCPTLTPRPVARQTPLSMGFPRQEY